VQIPWGITANQEILYDVTIVVDPEISSAFHTEMSAFMSSMFGETINTDTIMTAMMGYLGNFNTTIKVKINDTLPITALDINEVETWQHEDTWDIRQNSDHSHVGGAKHVEWCNTSSSYHEETVWGSLGIKYIENTTYADPSTWLWNIVQQEMADPDINFMFGNTSSMEKPGAPRPHTWDRLPLSTWMKNWTQGEQECGRYLELELPWGNSSRCDFNWSKGEDGGEGGDYNPPPFPDPMMGIKNGPMGIFIVPIGFDLTEFYDFGKDVYEYDYQYWHTESPAAAVDGDGDGCDGDCDGSSSSGPSFCGDIPLEMPPTIDQMFEYAGVQNVIVEPLKATVSYKYYAMDKWFRNCFETMNMGSVSDMDARAALGIEWNPNDGALDWFKICMDVEADVDTNQLEICTDPYNPTGPCIPPLPEGVSLPNIQETVKFHAEAQIVRQGVTEPNCSSLYGPDVEKKEGLKEPDPDDVMVFSLPNGECVERVLWGGMGVEMRIEVCDDGDTAGGSNVTLTYWPDNPSEGGKSPGFPDDEGIYFAIDVEGGVELPLNLTVDLPGSLPPSLVGAAASEIAAALKIVVWNDAIDNWEDVTDFPVTYNSTANTITISITHLSVFAVGFDEQALMMIPSYSPAILVVALFGAVAVILFRMKRR
jgi:hypothetical protein